MDDSIEFDLTASYDPATLGDVLADEKNQIHLGARNARCPYCKGRAVAARSTSERTRREVLVWHLPDACCGQRAQETFDQNRRRLNDYRAIPNPTDEMRDEIASLEASQRDITAKMQQQKLVRP